MCFGERDAMCRTLVYKASAAQGVSRNQQWIKILRARIDYRYKEGCDTRAQIKLTRE